MKGPDLAKLLRELGFDNIKTHMTVLDDADLMMVEARLATTGLKRQPADEDQEATGGLRKKRSLSAVAEEVEEEASADAEPKKRLLKKKSLPAPAARRAAEPTAEAPSASPPPAPSSATPVEPKQLDAAPAAAMHDDGSGTAMERAPAKAEPKPTLGKAESADKAAAETAGKPAAERTEPAAEEAAQSKGPANAEPQPQVAKAEATQAEPEAPKAAPAAAEQPTKAKDDQGSTAETAAFPAPKEAIEPQPADKDGGDAAASTTDEAAPAKEPVRKLLVPQKKATVVGRIELPQETIRDATRRSAPAAPRDLRRAALQKMQQRGAVRQVPLPGQRRGPAGRGGRDGQRGPGRGKSRTAAPIDPTKLVEVQEPVSMKALSEALGIKVNELIAAFMFKLKIPGKNINSMLSNDEVELVALELNRNIRVVEAKEAMDELIEQLVEANEGQETAQRAPVVTFMGHVDHGKTSLMDALRHSDVTKHEAGGITQHIGAYKITSDDGLSIVVLDTPGHAAFTAMRARGAELTDVVVLVVAADDGVMPQTEEAISHAKAAGVPIVVAVTKCDLPGANPMQVKQQLMIKGLQSEDFGGEIGVVEVSSKTGQGLGDLIERIHLEAEILDLNARPDAAGKGVVVEARQSAEQGVVVTLLVTDGTLRLKDQVVCGESFARIRAMIDDHGTNLTEAGPSTPVTLFGLDRLPTPGDKLYAVEDAKKAKEVVEERQRRMREMSRAERSAVTLETLSAKLAERDIKEIKLILKADAMGSLEPLRKCLDDLATDEVRVNLVHSGLGGINKADVDLAATSGAVIVGFNTTADANVRALADEQGVDIRYYDVIYELLDQVKDAMEGVLAPEEVQSVIGHAEVRATFKSSKFGVIAGCRILDGVARRSSQVRLAREGKVVWSGKLASLRRIDEDVKEVKQGFECGMTLDGFQDIKEGDVLEFVHTELVKRTLGG
ncbi:MAG: translation initiation factor IF-2 [Planctomycetes bacterium]|nr:translation initiation factor IF-2 [Planctomycetota bacterium]